MVLLARNKYVTAIVGSALIALMVMPALVSPVLAATEWYVTRPTSSVVYNDQHIENAYTDNIAAVGLGVQILEYVENSPTYQGNDFLSFRISSSANTRVGISYTVSRGGLSFWYNAATPTGIVSDDQSKPFTLPYPFRFYGKVYRSVYVCSNGFLSFDSSSNSYSPQSIPNGAAPNTLVAGFWRDLNPAKGGSITYFSGLDSSNLYVFAVSWNSVPNFINSNTQTFQIILRQSRVNYEDDIIFSYSSITKDVSTTVGIEDQTGLKGTSYGYSNLGNYAGLTFQSSVLPKTITALTIKVQKYVADYSSAFNIQPSETGGYNVKLQSTSNPVGDAFVTAIKGLVPIMIGSVVGAKAGIMLELILIGADIAYQLSRELSPIPPTGIKNDGSLSEQLAYVKGEGALENPNNWYLYDSTLATTVVWKFTDTGSVSHTVQVTAELEYYDWAAGSKTISSSVYMSVLKNSGGSCPTLYAWNGEEYVDEGILNIHATDDITVRQVIPRENLVSENGMFALSLREMDNFISHIDYIKLYAVDSSGKLQESQLAYAVHNKLGNVIPLLLFDDNKKVNLYPSETLDVKFTHTNADEIDHFIFEINGVNYK